jgi:hypothetical protein
VVLVTEVAPHRLPIADRPSKGVPVGTKTITMYVSDLDQSEIPAGRVYQLSIRHPDGATQQLDISEKNYRALKLQDLGKTLKKRGRKPGSTTEATSSLGRLDWWGWKQDADRGGLSDPRGHRPWRYPRLRSSG